MIPSGRGGRSIPGDLIAFVLELQTRHRLSDRALTRFAKGDSFVAEGYVRTYQVERDGEAFEREELVAKKIGHDVARTNSDVDRVRRPAASAELDLPATQQVIPPATEPAPVGVGPRGM